MNISEVFSQLTFGEFSQLSLGGGDMGEINASNYDRVISHVNLGLTALYKRFPLKEERLTVVLEQGKFTYPLAATDILKVERVYTDSGYELGLNDGGNIYAVSTPSATVLRVPPVLVANGSGLSPYLKTASLEVVYRANHPILRDIDVDTCVIELPYTHLEPLLYYVASRVHNPIGMTPQTEFNAGNNYAAKYEASCREIETLDLQVDQGAQYDRIGRGGWV